jgi:hypothetical protein
MAVLFISVVTSAIPADDRKTETIDATELGTSKPAVTAKQPGCYTYSVELAFRALSVGCAATPTQLIISAN